MSKHTRHRGHGKHHRPTRAEREAAERAEAVREEAIRDQRTTRIQNAHAQSIQELAPHLAAWQQQLAAGAVTGEVEISPLKVPMRVLSDFDNARQYPNGKPYLHSAFDGVPAEPVPNAEVVAMTSGYVIAAKEFDPASGDTVMIGGSNRHIYSYAHLDTIAVKVGDFVKQGDVIGIMGKTGNAGDFENGVLHVTVRAPENTMNLVAGVTGAPNESDVDFATYKRIPPTINGRPVLRNMVIEPGVSAIPPTVIASVAPVVAPEQLESQTFIQVAPLDIGTHPVAPLDWALPTLPNFPKPRQR